MVNVENLKVYKYKASLKNGRTVTGNIYSFSEEEAKRELKNRDLYLLKIKNNTPFYSKWTKPSDLEKGLLFEKISEQLKTGSDFQRILNNLKRDNFSFASIKMIEGLLLEIKKGKGFGDALKSLNLFSSEIIEIVFAGEESAKLVEVLKDLSELFIEQSNIKKTVLKASFKPIGLLIFSFLIVIFIIPRMLEPIKGVFKSFENKIEGEGIPAITTMVINMIEFISGKGGISLGLTTLLLFFLGRYYYLNNLVFKRYIDYKIIELPLIGLFKKKLTSYITFLSLNVLYKAGIPITVSFFMIAKSQNNIALKEDLLAVAEELKEGKSLNKAINQSLYITPRLKDMIIQGDLSGSLEYELKKGKILAKKDFDEFSEILIKGLVSIVGFLVSLLVATIIISVYLPIFSMVNQIMSNMK